MLSYALNTNQGDPEVIGLLQDGKSLLKHTFFEQKGTPFEFIRGMSEIDPGYALHETGLNKVDQAVVKGEVFSWRGNYKRLEADENTALAAGKVTHDNNQAKADLTTATAQKLQTTLSPNGAAQFKTFILGQCEAHYTIEQCKVMESWPTPNVAPLEDLLDKIEKDRPTADEKEESIPVRAAFKKRRHASPLSNSPVFKHVVPRYKRAIIPVTPIPPFGSESGGARFLAQYDFAPP